MPSPWPTVLLLVVSPNTQLSQRLARKGRLLDTATHELLALPAMRHEVVLPSIKGELPDQVVWRVELSPPPAIGIRSWKSTASVWRTVYEPQAVFCPRAPRRPANSGSSRKHKLPRRQQRIALGPRFPDASWPGCRGSPMSAGRCGGFSCGRRFWALPASNTWPSMADRLLPKFRKILPPHRRQACPSESCSRHTAGCRRCATRACWQGPQDSHTIPAPEVRPQGLASRGRPSPDGRGQGPTGTTARDVTQSSCVPGWPAPHSEDATTGHR